MLACTAVFGQEQCSSAVGDLFDAEIFIEMQRNLAVRTGAQAMAEPWSVVE
jgi:hypothetical protein